MVLLQRNDLYFTVTLILLSLQTTSLEASQDSICPIGFDVAYKKNKDKDPICYRLKTPEAFEDKFKNCNGNFFSLDLYNDLNITKPNTYLWTDYKTSVPGGPFMDWSYTSSTGNLLTTSDDVNDDATTDYDDFCVVTHPVTNLTATRCQEKHERYCFVKPYEEKPSSEGCGSPQSLRFWSPTSICMALFKGNRTDFRAYWNQSQGICVKRGGLLLYEGWRYSNNLLLLNGTEETRRDFPLGVKLNALKTLERIDSENKFFPISSNEWNFENPIKPDDFLYGSVRKDLLYYVKGNKHFKSIICEEPIQLRTVHLVINQTINDRLYLTTDYKLDKKHILCFTDSYTYYVTKARNVNKIDDYTFELALNYDKNGYFWCVHNDFQHYYPSESNKVLFLKSYPKIHDLYAVKIRINETYNLVDVQTKFTDWRKTLEKYVFYKTEYDKYYGYSLYRTNTTEAELKKFKNGSNLKLKNRSVVKSFSPKQVYLSGKIVLAHVELGKDIKPVVPGTWDNLDILYMKPAYYCGELKNHTKQPTGVTVEEGCVKYTCQGDFNSGVQWVETAIDGCPTTSLLKELEIPKNTGESSEEEGEYSEDEESTTLESLQENTTTILETVMIVNTPTDRPARPPRPPPIEITTTEVPTTTEIPTTTEQPVLSIDEELNEIIDGLEVMVNNTAPIMVDDIRKAFNQVSKILAVEDDTLAVPGRLLHLLDNIGARIDLNGSLQEMVVKDNIALLMTDASLSNPVTGLKIATSPNAVFNENAFQIMNDQINDTHLSAADSELVVQLPQSVAASSRRISFVVFRNDRAFQSSHGLQIVNSKVVSVNVEDLTQFDAGEEIVIHLTPATAILELNQSRTCAYWEFDDDNITGQWSQKGCTFKPATKPGLLDTCHCEHLTHFAEILIPSDFSQIHEDILEVISIVGCVLSIFGIAMVGLTAALFRSWRRDFNNKIWLQLCIAIFLLSLCFLIIVFVKFNKYDVICMLLGVVLHYSVLASFCWMLVAAILSYRRLVLVFTRDASHKLLRASAFAWGVPCAIVGILLSAAPQSYEGRFDEKTPSASFCYPTGLAMWLTIYAPIAIMLLANWTLFVLIVRSVFASARIPRHGNTNEAIRCATVSCLLVFLFGLPWIFGLFASNVVAAYFFTLTATFQGFVLFVFFVVGNKKTRDLWLNKLKIKQTRMVPVTSSTYTNRSTGASRPAGPASIEVKFSKPRSLASPDDSRFS